MIRATIIWALVLVGTLFVTECVAFEVEEDTRTDAVLLHASQSEMLMGSWFGSKGEGPIIISKSGLTSKNGLSSAGCKTPYTIVGKSIGKTFPDQQPSFQTGSAVPLAVGRWVSIKLKIKRKQCQGDGNFGFMQLSFMTTDASYLAAFVVQYDVWNRPIAWYTVEKR